MLLLALAVGARLAVCVCVAVEVDGDAIDGEAAAFERGTQRRHVLFQQLACLVGFDAESGRNGLAFKIEANVERSEGRRIEAEDDGATRLIEGGRDALLKLRGERLVGVRSAQD